ncbi:uncharacterized protein LOC134276295 [Saccostrea cucullata]|uniref:uncharacterized protein LOC134276295 n=1 Tax=Saccostrea cuccullata TaxID=36930 RepID=UPI002ED50440
MPRKQDLELEFQLSKQKQEHELRLKTLELEHEKEILELRVQLEKANSTPGAHSTGMSKIKLQPFNQEKDDILCYLSEFDAVAEHAGWTENSKALQLRSLLTGEAREVSQQVTSGYRDLYKALLNRFGKRPADYFQFLEEIKRRPGETYRGLMSRIDLYLSRFIDEKDPVQKFREEYFLKALSPQQAQWIRRNKGSSELVEAAEDYILPTKSAEDRKLLNPKVLGEKKSQEQGNSGKQKSLEKVKCFSCGNFGHYANKCPKKGNLASCFVKGALWGLHYVPGKVDDVEVSMVKDTGASMTLLREDLVDPKCVLHGQTTSLFTAIGQPFEAKLAVVNLETPMFKGHVQVGLVPDLVADGLLGIDVLERNKVAAVVTRAKAKEQEQNELSAKNRMNKCDVVPRDLNVVVTNDGAGEVNLDLPEISLEKLSVVNGNKLSNLQKQDPTLKNCKDKAFKNVSQTETEHKAFYWENDILKRKWTSKKKNLSGTQVVLPASLRKAVMKLAHDQPIAGHLGTEKTKQRILASFYWPGLFQDVSDYCAECDTCQKVAKRSAERAPMVNTPIITDPFSKIAMDIVGPLNRTTQGNKYILTVIDEATRYPDAFALPSCEAERIADTLITLFSRVGIPKTILTDQGSNFTSALLKDLYEKIKIKGITTTPYHPQANGKVERFNGTLKSMLKKLCMENGEDWDVLLPYVLFAYREVPHEETGFSPFDLLYGWPVRGPLSILKSFMTGEEEIKTSEIDHVVNIRNKLADVTQLVQNNLEMRQSKIKDWYDRSASKRTLRPGDEVLVLLPTEPGKMSAQWKGPFRVVNKVNDVNYKVNVGGRRGLVTYHINLLRPYNRATLLAATENEIGLEQQFPNDTAETISDLVFGHGLTQVQRQSLRDVCQKFSRIFTSKPGKCDVISHTIRTTSENPITQRPDRIPEAKKQEVKESLNEMLEQGLITPSKSPWASPIVLVNKPDGTIRICVDYRKLNEITLTDPYPIPRMSEIFEKIGSAKYLSRFDLTKGYWQVPLAKETREKSAFITPFGLFEFTVMPFGMKTSPASFIRLMDRILDGTQNTVAYFDDIIVYSQTWEDHIKHVTELLQRIYEANLTIRPSKCKLGAAEIICLGHIVGGGTIRPDPRKLKAMEDFPLPLTKKELRSFLGLTGYYRQYIGNYADITVPLTDLLRKSQPADLKWMEREVQSFKKLKEALMTAPVLVNPNFNLPFVLQTDASNNAIGAVLSQQLPDGDHPVAYLSKKLLPREKNYSTIEKELLAIVWAIGSFSYYLEGRKFYVETDHNPLTWLHRLKNKNQRLLRWALALQSYTFEVRYKRGSKNTNADGLSRI